MSEYSRREPMRTEPTGGRRRRLPHPSPRVFARVGLVGLSVAALLIAWSLAARHFPSYIFPSPTAVWDSFESLVDRGVWWQQVKATFGHMFTAFAITVAIGLPLGIVIGRYWPVEDLTRVPLIFLQTIPTVVLIALALIFVGTTGTGVIGVTVASCLPYFTLNVIQGTKSIDHNLVDMARSFKASEPTIMRAIIVPSVVPYFLAGGRIALGVAWQVTLFGEYLMGTPGIGFQVSTSIKLLDTAQVFAWGLTVVALTLVFEYGVFRPIEWLLTRHTRRG